jgi:pimeloyl-ACP methyl ester carboxylesterase
VLVRELAGFRCLVVDRPGWGMSAAVDFSQREYKVVVADVLRGVLDAFDLDEAHVVGGSIGNVWALRLAARDPARVGRLVLLGSSPLVPDVPVPDPIRLLASPLGTIMVRLSKQPRVVRSILRQSGHAASLADGRIPREFVDWRAALARDTASMHNERDMVRALVSRRSFRPGLTIGDAELASIQHPTLYVFGTADPVGTVELWRRAVGLLPNGELHLVDGGGHMPWFEDPRGLGDEVSRFLAA